MLVNMEVIIGNNAGFCYGVKNAVDKTIKELEERKCEKVYCLGELVHNKQVVEKLEKMGLMTVQNVSELSKASSKNDKVIIRAHGVSKSVYQKIEEKGYNVIDLTCPNVLNIHKIVREYIDKGYYVLLIGKKDHPEILGTYGWCKNKCSIIETIDDVLSENVRKAVDEHDKILVVAQTTFRVEKFNDIVSEVKNICKGIIEIKNTICNATKIRQEETERLAKDVDYMVIIGGKNSSNTKKLYEISSKYTKTIAVETVKELKKEDTNGYTRVGVMAGASTPENSINEVVDFLKKG